MRGFLLATLLFSYFLWDAECFVGKLEFYNFMDTLISFMSSVSTEMGIRGFALHVFGEGELFYG